MANQDIPSNKTSVRADKWLCATRFFKTRSQAAKACDGGKVRKQGGEPMKASTALRIDDVVLVPAYEGRCLREIHITKLIDKRVGAPEAQLCYEDRTPNEILEQAREELKELRNNRTMLGVGGKMSKRDRRVWEKTNQENRGFFG